MFDMFDLYGEGCNYYVKDSYNYFLTHEDEITTDNEQDFFTETDKNQNVFQ